MATNFCPNCGSKLIAEAKFCADCGHVQAQVVTSSPQVSQLNPGEKSKPTSMKGFMIGVGATLVAVVLVFVVTSLRPAEPTSVGNGSTSQDNETAVELIRLEGKTASEVLSQLVKDGFCIVAEPRSDLSDYSVLLELYDANLLRVCDESTTGNYIWIYANQTSSDMEWRLDNSSDEQIVYGTDWILILSSNESSTLVDLIAEKYSGIAEIR
jgi:hypothetical protein